MTSAARRARQANLRGALWMIAAMAAFAVEDALIKGAAAAVPLGQILMIFGAGGALFFAALARLNGAPVFVPEVLSRPMVLRVGFEMMGRLFYVCALWLIPLSLATAILQATPLVVVAGAALVFGEKVGWLRWGAIVFGLIGVLIILRPGGSDVSWLALLAVIGMLGFAGRDLASRAAPAALSTPLLGLYGFLPVVLVGALVTLWQGTPLVWPSGPVALCLSGSIIAGVAAYACLMKAMRGGDVSAVTPFRYTRLLFGTALGLLVFDEDFSLSMALGSGLIVLSGLFILWRGQWVPADRQG